MSTTAEAKSGLDAEENLLKSTEQPIYDNLENNYCTNHKSGELFLFFSAISGEF